jgi:hypothetical protein
MKIFVADHSNMQSETHTNTMAMLDCASQDITFIKISMIDLNIILENQSEFVRSKQVEL